MFRFQAKEVPALFGKNHNICLCVFKIFVVHRIFINKLDGYKKFVFSITNFNNQKLDFPVFTKNSKYEDIEGD